MVERNKQPPVNKVNTVRLLDFSGGVNSTISGSLLNINEAQEAKNMSLEQKGTIKPRKGRVKRYATPFDDSPSTGVGMLFKQDGTSHLITAAADKLYSDAPRISEKWQHREDWDLGSDNGFVDYDREDGSIMLKAGNERLITDPETGALIGTAGSTYGYRFKPNKDVKVYKVYWTPKKVSSTYKISLWDSEGVAVWTSEEVIGEEDTEKVDSEQTIELYSSPLALAKDTEYTVSIQCDIAEGITEYTPSSDPLVNDLIDFVGAYKNEGSYAYPATSVSGKSFYNVEIGFELTHNVVSIVDKTSMDEGTYNNISYETPSEISGKVNEEVDASSLDEYDHVKLDKDSIIPCVEVRSLVGMTNANENNADENHYPYIREHDFDGNFPTGTTHWNDTQAPSDAEMVNISRDDDNYWQTDDPSTYDRMVLEFRHYLQTEKASIDNVKIELKVASQRAGVDLDLYLCPTGGTIWGSGNDLILVKSVNPEVAYEPYDLSYELTEQQITDCVDPSTGELKFFVTQNDDSYYLRLYYNQVYIKNLSETIDFSDITCGYKVKYDGVNWSPEFTFTGDMADFSIHKYDKSVSNIVQMTSITSTLYELANEPQLLFCGKSGLTHERESASVQEDTLTGKGTGTLGNVEVIDDGEEKVQLTKQGVDTTKSVDLSLGTFNQTEFDVDKVRLTEDPNTQGTTPLAGYNDAKEFTIDHNVVDANEVDYPVMAKLYQDPEAPLWSSVGGYTEGDVVKHNGHYYKKSQTTNNAEPHVGTNWFLDWHWLGIDFDFSKVQSDGKDIRFTIDDGQTLLDYERELFDLQPAYEGLSFDGVDDYVSLSSDNTPNSSFTIMAEGSTETTATSYGASADVQILYQSSTCILAFSQNMVELIGFNTSGNNAYSVRHSFASPVISTINIVGVINGDKTDTSNYKIYIDGVEVATSVAFNNNTTNDNHFGVNIGRTTYENSSSTWNINGSGIISNELFWNRALSSQEILDTYNGTIEQNGLIAQYKFDEGTGTTLTDSAGTNDGTINGAIWVNESAKNQAVFHVRIPSVSSTEDTKYLMFYNNPSETVDGENKTGVWDSNFVMVQHMGDSLADSTSNGNDGTNFGSTVVDGLNGKARSFDNDISGGTTRIETPLYIPNNSTITIVATVPPTTTDYQALVGDWWYNATTGGHKNVGISAEGIIYNNSSKSGTVIDRNSTLSGYDNSSYLCINSTIGNGLMGLSVNDIVETSVSNTISFSPQYPVMIGRWRGGSGATLNRGLIGTIDEVRISNIARSDAWQKMDDYNLRRWELYSSIQDVNFVEYYDTGTYESQVLDFSDVVEEITSEDSLVLTFSEPDDSNITISVRTSQDNSTWTSYSEVTGGTIPYAPYIQLKVDFANSTDRYSTPNLSEITVGYKTAYHHSGTWESQVFDLLDANHLDSLFHVVNDVPTGTDISVEVAGSDDNVTFSAWSTITENDSLPVNRYVKFKVTLTPNTTLDVTPQHNGFRIFVSKLFKDLEGTWESPVYDISKSLYDTSEYKWVDYLLSGDASTKVEISRSYNNSVWEPWEEVTPDAELPETDYYIKFRLTANVSTDRTKQILTDGFEVHLKDVSYRPVWTSDVKNIAEAKDLSSGRLVPEYINNSGGLTLMSRTSPNGTDSWSDWEHIDIDGNLMSDVNPYVQVKVIFLGLNSKLTELTLSMDGNPEATTIGMGLTLGASYSFTTLRDTLIVANGKDEMKKWDGLTETIETLGGGVSPMKMVTTHHNRVWGVDAENPSRVRYSSILDPETWGAFDFIDFNPEDGDYITALMRYGQNLLVSKKRSMALLTGNKTSNYNVSWLDSEAGCTGQYAITQGGQYICYVAQDGIRFTDLAQSAVATERLLPHWGKINHRKLTQASMVYWRNKLFVALPSENSQINDTVWTYDFLRNAWTINDKWNIAQWLKFNQYGEDVLIASSSAEGQLYVVDETNYDDNDVIEYSWLSKDFNFEYPERYKLFRNIYLDIEGIASENTLYVDLYVDGVLEGTYSTVIPAGKDVKHTRRVLPPLYNAVLGRMLTVGLRGRCGIQGITIEYVVRGAVPSGNL